MSWRRRAAQFDTSWARRPAAQATREVILNYVLGPLIDYYTAPIVLGTDLFDGLKPPVVFVANHSSHLDTPSVLRSLPRKWRRKTAVLAAADYFYKNRVYATLVSLSFAAVPIDRKGGLTKGTTERIARLVDEQWNVLLFPEGTRSRTGQMGSFRHGASYIAVEHSLPVVPVYLHGMHDAMPVGRGWPRKHPCSIHFGQPVYPVPGEDPKKLTVRVRDALTQMRIERAALD
ncbi:MAG TPA: lysophospholipid acyltransferase family protein [Actinomycetota bacterium]|nr:lysophospholipid acyltransferase family protein [Actinomycetota bacterium]